MSAEDIEKYAFLTGDFKALSRAITIVENNLPGYQDILLNLPASSAQIIGITGPPGAGKSSLTDALIAEMVGEGKKVAVLCIDPSSPFNQGALLGDRIRMSDWFNRTDVFIRSLASRGALGGLHPKIIEIADLIKSAGFDYVLVETVGVGQSEVDIAGLADTTVVVLVPEAGDVIQTMKAGLMEIANIFVVNKSDRPGADTFYNHLKKMLIPASARTSKAIPVFKTIASERKGIAALYRQIQDMPQSQSETMQTELLAQRAWAIIQERKMQGMDIQVIRQKIAALRARNEFNLYQLVEEFV